MLNNELHSRNPENVQALTLKANDAVAAWRGVSRQFAISRHAIQCLGNVAFVRSKGKQTLATADHLAPKPTSITCTPYRVSRSSNVHHLRALWSASFLQLES